MDGWMSGRTDVDLGGACRTGGGRGRDKQSDQEEIIAPSRYACKVVCYPRKEKNDDQIIH